MSEQNHQLQGVESSKKSFRKKVNEHKKGIIIATTICTAVAGVIIYQKISLQHLKEIRDLNIPYPVSPKNAPIVLPENTTIHNIADSSISKISNVHGHPRNLPIGYKASQKQLDIANALGIPLTENQTYVIDHIRNCCGQAFL